MSLIELSNNIYRSTDIKSIENCIKRKFDGDPSLFPDFKKRITRYFEINKISSALDYKNKNKLKRINNDKNKRQSIGEIEEDDDDDDEKNTSTSSLSLLTLSSSTSSSSTLTDKEKEEIKVKEKEKEQEKRILAEEKERDIQTISYMVLDICLTEKAKLSFTSIEYGEGTQLWQAMVEAYERTDMNMINNIRNKFMNDKLNHNETVDIYHQRLTLLQNRLISLKYNVSREDFYLTFTRGLGDKYAAELRMLDLHDEYKDMVKLLRKLRSYEETEQNKISSNNDHVAALAKVQNTNNNGNNNNSRNNNINANNNNNR
jgi:hypothetical protein